MRLAEQVYLEQGSAVAASLVDRGEEWLIPFAELAWLDATATVQRRSPDLALPASVEHDLSLEATDETTWRLGWEIEAVGREVARIEGELRVRSAGGGTVLSFVGEHMGALPDDDRALRGPELLVRTLLGHLRRGLQAAGR